MSTDFQQTTCNYIPEARTHEKGCQSKEGLSEEYERRKTPSDLQIQ
jgi:hypothetical protein